MGCRTMEQRYKKPADWNIIGDQARQPGHVPIIGNGDILTYYEVGCPAMRCGFQASSKLPSFLAFLEARADEG